MTVTHRLRKTFNQLVQTDEVDEGLGESTRENIPAALDLLVQGTRLELGLQVVQRAGELIGDSSSQHLAVVTSVFLVKGDKLGRGVSGDESLNVLDVGLVEGGRRTVLEQHVGNIFLVIQSETSQDLLRTRGDTSLVGTRVLVKLDSLGFESLTGLLSDEQVGSLHNVLEVTLALGVEQLVDVGQVDRLRSTSTRNEHVGLEAKMGEVSVGRETDGKQGIGLGIERA